VVAEPRLHLSGDQVEQALQVRGLQEGIHVREASQQRGDIAHKAPHHDHKSLWLAVLEVLERGQPAHHFVFCTLAYNAGD
jgi:hypothetical protein